MTEMPAAVSASICARMATYAAFELDGLRPRVHRACARWQAASSGVR